MASDEVGRKDSKNAVIEEWMREHGERLLAAAERYATPVVGAQDIVQEALVTAWKKWEQRPPAERVGAWLRGMVRNVGMRVARRRAHRAELLRQRFEETGGMVWDGQELAEPWDDPRRDWVEDAIRHLPPRLREVAALVLEEQMENAEIAESLGVSRVTVRVYWGRVVADLKRRRKKERGWGGIDRAVDRARVARRVAAGRQSGTGLPERFIRPSLGPSPGGM